MPISLIVRSLFRVIVVCLLVPSAGCDNAADFTVPDPTATPEGWTMVWADEFDGTTLDESRWSVQLGNGCPDLCGWGNSELQVYTQEAVSVGGGVLTITAHEDADGSFTSGRIRTKGNGDWTYGRFEVRARLPIGQGLWPAVWLLASDEVYGAWAASGEIDIVEAVGSEPGEIFGTLHHGGTFPDNTSSGKPFDLVHGTFADDFFVFAVEWEEGEIRWYVNNVLYQTQTEWTSTGGPYPAPFDQSFYLILNVAVGGTLPGPPDDTTVFPQQMVIDYVRVFERRS